MYFKSEKLLNQERILETPCFLIPWCTCSQKLWVQILRIDSWCEEKYQSKYSSIFISYLGFNEANTNILHLTSHIYSNIDLEIWRIENYWGSQGFQPCQLSRALCGSAGRSDWSGVEQYCSSRGRARACSPGLSRSSDLPLQPGHRRGRDILQHCPQLPERSKALCTSCTAHTWVCVLGCLQMFQFYGI